MEYLPVLLLFVAALAFGWFYLQRAKARDAAKAGTSPADVGTTAHATAGPASVEDPEA